MATPAGLAGGQNRDWLYRHLLDTLGGGDKIDWSRAAIDSASVPAPRRRADQAQPD